MTKDEALKQTLEAFEALVKHFSDVSAYEDDEHAFTNELIFIPNIKKAIKAITAIKEALALPVQEPDCYGYAARLATSIWKQHYQKTAPEWQVFDELMGVLTQIDNMAAGLISPPAAQPEERNFCPRCGKRTADLTVIHTCTPPQENT